LIDDTVAIVIGAIASLRGTGVWIGIAVVAVGSPARIVVEAVQIVVVTGDRAIAVQATQILRASVAAAAAILPVAHDIGLATIRGV
jgi:hypothetical protein